MDNVLFLLIDNTQSFLKTRYLKELKTIHENLLKKIRQLGGEILVAGPAQQHFNNAKELFSYAAAAAKGRDIIAANAYSGALCVDQTKEILNFLRNRQYDISFAEHMPEGLIPSVIAGGFAEDFLYFLDEKISFDTPFKELVNWEYKGIDVGIYLSSSRIAMERIDFLPVEKNSILYLNELSDDLNFTLEKAETFVRENRAQIHRVPHYVAVELCPKTDAFHTADFSDKSHMTLQLFANIIQELDLWAPEAVLSLGVWGEPFAHPLFQDLFQQLKNNQERRIIVESRTLILDKNLASLVLSRPNTELIFDLSPKLNLPSDEELNKFFSELPNHEKLWVRLTRAHKSEELIPKFLKTWKYLMPRIIITKADSFGDPSVKTVDLAPIRRHACYALSRDITILSDGTVMLCRQNIDLSGSPGNAAEESLENLWKKNLNQYLNQHQGQISTCKQCQGCDDWWIFNF